MKQAWVLAISLALTGTALAGGGGSLATPQVLTTPELLATVEHDLATTYPSPPTAALTQLAARRESGTGQRLYAIASAFSLDHDNKSAERNRTAIALYSTAIAIDGALVFDRLVEDARTADYARLHAIVRAAGEAMPAPTFAWLARTLPATKEPAASVLAGELAQLTTSANAGHIAALVRSAPSTHTTYRLAGAAIDHGAGGDAVWQLVLTGLTSADPTARDGARQAFRASLVPVHFRPKFRAVFATELARTPNRTNAGILVELGAKDASVFATLFAGADSDVESERMLALHAIRTFHKHLPDTLRATYVAAIEAGLRKATRKHEAYRSALDVLRRDQ